MQTLSLDQLRGLRLAAQRLTPAAARTVSGAAALVRTLIAIQAQELPSATLAVRPRSVGLRAEDVRQAREDDRSIVLTWTLRSTLHLVAAEDLGWMLALLGPRLIRQGQRRYAQLGLDEDTRQRAARLLRDTLHARGPLTRPQLADVLAAHVIPVAGQAIAHLVAYAALSGAICFGPERGGKLTYVALDDWLSPDTAPRPEHVLPDLARRYLDAYGPAAPQDFAVWSGLPMGEARAGFAAIATDLLDVQAEGESLWMLKRANAPDEPGSEALVRFLPAYDPVLLGYRGREWMVGPAHTRRIHPGGGLLYPTVIVNGRAAAVWRRKPTRRGLTVEVEPFAALPAELRPALEAEAHDIGRYLQQDVELRITPSPTP